MSVQPTGRPADDPWGRPALRVVPDQPEADYVAVPAGQLRTLLELMQGAAELREREVAAAYERGYVAGTMDEFAQRKTWEIAWETAQRRIEHELEQLALMSPPEQWHAEQRAAHRARTARWVETGVWEDVPWGDL